MATNRVTKTVKKLVSKGPKATAEQVDGKWVVSMTGVESESEAAATFSGMAQEVFAISFHGTFKKDGKKFVVDRAY